MDRSEDIRRNLLSMGQKKFGPIPAEIKPHLQKIQDLSDWDQIVDQLCKARSWEELLENLSNHPK